MKPALIVVCDERSEVFGEEVYRASAYEIDDLARAVGTDHIELREALLVMGGEIDGPHPIRPAIIEQALRSMDCGWRVYDEKEEGSIDKLVKEAVRRRHEVFCSFSFC
jgi:hypothetical protein